MALETYGNESKCFEQFGMWIAESPTGVIHASRTGSGCYRVRCPVITSMSLNLEERTHAPLANYFLF